MSDLFGNHIVGFSHEVAHMIRIISSSQRPSFLSRKARDVSIMKTCPCNIVEIFLTVKIQNFGRTFLIFF